jgi:tRNA dimethylallyltransferase
MQCHAALRVLTARPRPEEEAALPHRLYGVLPPEAPGGAAWWRDAALAAIAEARAAGRQPILCGGTGLYLHALLTGLAAIPDPGAGARQEARALLASLGAPGLHARLAREDPATAARLRPSDAQRIARAWEVWRGTGTGLADWQARQTREAPPPRAAIVLLPPREALAPAIRARWQAMLEAGAVEEVRALLRLDLDPALPVLRAHGVPELAAMLAGRLTLAEASERAIAATLRYARRQRTWLRHHALAEAGAMLVFDARWGDAEQLPSAWDVIDAMFAKMGVDGVGGGGV